MPANIPESVLKKYRRVGAMLNALARVSPSLSGRVAFKIFCMPTSLPVREKDQAFLQTARHETFYLDGNALRAYHWAHPNAEAPWLLFLHGWESNTARWQKFIKAALAEGYAVAAFDAPASGYSEGKILNALLYSKTLHQFYTRYGTPYGIVAHSLGGAAAVFGLTLLELPKPEKLVLLASFSDSTRVIQDFAQVLGANEKVVSGMYKHIEKRSGFHIDTFSVRVQVSSLKQIKGLVMHDRDDDVAPVNEGREIAANWASEYVETEGLGHKLQDKSVVQQVMQFLKTDP
jgi:pimeloyl-ACP methyl ester carboxylesterase